MDLTNLNKDRKLRRKSGSPDLGTMMFGKVPPQAKDLEEAVLGAIMLEKSAFDLVTEILKPECFYVEANQRIFRAMQGLQQKNLPIDLLTVVEELKFREELEVVGGAYYVTKLTNAVVSSANIEAHSRIILQKFIQRELIRISGEIIGDAYEDSTDVFELLDESEAKLFKITNEHLRRDYVSIDKVLMKTIERIEDLRNRQDDISGVPSGFAKLDHITYGWQPTDLIVLAARPSVGKTAFALNLARNAALHPTKPTSVGFFSLEMSAGQLVQRILSAESEIWLEKISRGRLEEHEMKQLYKKGIERLASAPIHIDDTAALNIFELRAKCRRLKSKHDVGLIVIDYLQLMSGTSENRNTNREQEISRISRDLKGLAKELNIPIIALSQLSREVEKRGAKDGQKIPQLSDLRECVTGDTLVWLTNGQRVPIKNLAGKNADVFTLDSNHEITTSSTELIWPVGIKKVYELKLASGRIIKATADHKIFCFDDWKMIKQIQPGERVGVTRNIPEPSVTTSISNHKLIISGNDQLKSISESDIFWDEVTNITLCGEEEVFDLTVKNTHNWIANEGIITHNSGAIEQDADMVMFLYRPEYYDITTNELGESNKGETHIRIAKHRNGQLDTIKLKALLHIQKFIEEDGTAGLPEGNWKPYKDDDGGAKLYIQKGSKMNDGEFDDETPF